ncbi:hypothetical protein BJ546DRAFT_123251 [Cryomyces antarcticus]
MSSKYNCKHRAAAFQLLEVVNHLGKCELSTLSLYLILFFLRLIHSLSLIVKGRHLRSASLIRLSLLCLFCASSIGKPAALHTNSIVRLRGISRGDSKVRSSRVLHCGHQYGSHRVSPRARIWLLLVPELLWWRPELSLTCLPFGEGSQIGSNERSGSFQNTNPITRGVRYVITTMGFESPMATTDCNREPDHGKPLRGSHQEEAAPAIRGCRRPKDVLLFNCIDAPDCVGSRGTPGVSVLVYRHHGRGTRQNGQDMLLSARGLQRYMLKIYGKITIIGETTEGTYSKNQSTALLIAPVSLDNTHVDRIPSTASWAGPSTCFKSSRQLIARQTVLTSRHSQNFVT